MILVDANLLLYAVNEDSPHHEPAREWLRSILNGDEDVAIPYISILAFLRLTTNRRIMPRPLEPRRATEIVASWLEAPHVSIVGPRQGHWNVLRNLVDVFGAAGNLTTDAHIATMAIERGCAVYSADYDFARFPGVVHVDPLRR